MNASLDRASPFEESDDAFLGGRLHVLQPGTGYRAGLEAVLLAATVEATPGAKVLDVGAGVGVVGLCVAHRLPDVDVAMVERDRRLAELARRNAERNGLSGRVHVIEADVLRPLGATRELLAAAESFDHVLANPPFHIEGRGTVAGDPVKAGANAMPAGALDRWTRFLAAMARPGGIVTLIHRAEALAEVLTALEGRFGGAMILPVHPREGQPAARVLVRAVKGSRAPLELRPGLVLHDAEHRFRPAIAAVLRGGRALPLGGH
ncbi:MAG: methyltransferase [Hyphomicrobiaceae bacterium]|nr:methyltransferase [Hyphomicrobiaceae bacterium]